MGYQALLFCPDEKTARTVTQVLGELEFSVEACLEPFAAVKKLMSEHFDAVVVDCDNEQNATLLFKSARNSTSNQASLAVAVVEGQAGVAKAFRIGANLVLTKPINIEQSKGTLRVARGLLRKGDPTKPAAATASMPAASATKPVAPKPAAPVKPAATTAVSTARPAAPPVAKPAASAIPAKAAVATSAPATKIQDAALPTISNSIGSKEIVSKEIGNKESVAPPSFDSVGPIAPAAPLQKPPVLESHAASIDVSSGFTSTPPASGFGSGAASAPAPAREHHEPQSAEISTASVPDANAEVSTSAPAADDSQSFVGSAPSFTFGGANTAEESSGGNKKIIFGVAAAAIVAAALYFGWSSFQGHSSQPSTTPATTAPAPISAPQTAKPVTATPKSAAPAPSSSSAQTIAQAPADEAAINAEADETTSAKSSNTASKLSGSASPAGKSVSGKVDAAPLVVKGGSSPSLHAKSAAADTAAPSLIGMATTGSSAPPPNLGNGAGNEPAPVLQTINISQGVSQGLLIHKVQPLYPRNALSMHVEGAVELMATISTTGNITAVKVLNGEPLLIKAAADAVKQWKYKPYLLNGEPVEIQTQITVNFKLPH